MNDIIKIIKIIDQYRIVINKGTDDGIENGQRFLIFSIDEELFDPDTHKTLGRLEIVKGTGKVIHAQENISTIISDMKSEPSRTIRKFRPLPSSNILQTFSMSMFGESEEVISSDTLPFTELKIGDLAKKM